MQPCPNVMTKIKMADFMALCSENQIDRVERLNVVNRIVFENSRGGDLGETYIFFPGLSPALHILIPERE